MGNLKIAIGSDHAGFNLKQKIMRHLENLKIEYKDFGCYTTESFDYPIVAKEVAKKVADKEFDRGILICGTGLGMSIVANKTKGIRAVPIENKFSAKATRQHNDSNVLCLGERVLEESLAIDIVDIWLKTEFEGGRHKKRIEMFE